MIVCPVKTVVMTIPWLWGLSYGVRIWLIPFLIIWINKTWKKSHLKLNVSSKLAWQGHLPPDQHVYHCHGGHSSRHCDHGNCIIILYEQEQVTAFLNIIVCYNDSVTCNYYIMLMISLRFLWSINLIQFNHIHKISYLFPVVKFKWFGQIQGSWIYAWHIIKTSHIKYLAFSSILYWKFDRTFQISSITEM